MSTPTIGVHARARALLTRVRREGTTHEMARLTELGHRDPRRLAELVCEVALLVTADGAIPWMVGEREPHNSELREMVLRHAHSLFTRGIQTGWVMWGERLYQRDAKRRQRFTSIEPSVADPAEQPSLTERRRQVLDLVTIGKTNDEIARELVLSLNTVKTHLKNLFRLFRVNTRAALIVAAREVRPALCTCHAEEADRAS